MGKVIGHGYDMISVEERKAAGGKRLWVHQPSFKQIDAGTMRDTRNFSDLFTGLPVPHEAAQAGGIT